MNSTNIVFNNKIAIANRVFIMRFSKDFGNPDAEASLENLRSTLHKLEHQNLRLRRLASITAHQLKTPLMSLLWQTDKMKKNISGEALQEYQDGLEKIDHCAKQIKQQFEEILGYGLDKKVRAKDSVQSVMESILGSLQSEKKIEYSISSAESDLYFDRFTLHTILQNLIINGLEHTKFRIFKIHLIVTKIENCLRIRYTDNSAGISANTWQDFTSKNQIRGRGLGLSIIQQAAKDAGVMVYPECHKSNSICLDIPSADNRSI